MQPWLSIFVRIVEHNVTILARNKLVFRNQKTNRIYVATDFRFKTLGITMFKNTKISIINLGTTLLCLNSSMPLLPFITKYAYLQDDKSITMTTWWARWRLKLTSLTIVYSTVYSGADQWKHQSSASLAFVRGIRRWPVNFPHKWPVTRKVFLFDDVIMAIFHATLMK